jgi:prevent-host-death family protein
MREATVAEAKDDLPELIQLVQAGECVVITESGRPVAQLVPAALGPGEVDWDARLERLERAGKITRGSGGPPDPRILASFRDGAKPSGVLDALLEERREGR